MFFEVFLEFVCHKGEKKDSKTPLTACTNVSILNSYGMEQDCQDRKFVLKSRANLPCYT